jgi:Asp-tRNA(Asn)/Glu-tRNA(Gln) amidotransferase A subunit family amidase
VIGAGTHLAAGDRESFWTGSAQRLVYGRIVHDAPLTQRSATALARAIREGEVSSRAVVEAHIEACKHYQPRTGAIAVERFDAARRDADAADARIANGDNELPLLGVPCTIKESFAVKGMANCAGLVARRDHRAATTAPTVQRLIDAGAIPLGLTNISELTLWCESDNRVYGRSSTPYDPSRAAGGSSGGEGAAVGSGASPFGLGSDIAGSIRVPAFFCGVFGHKPSNGLVPHTGSYPVPHGEAKRLLGFGPLARRGEDLMLLLRILSGPDGADPLVTSEPRLGDPASVSLEGLRVVISESAFVQPIKHELLAARERAAGALAAAGARLERVRLPKMRRIGEAYLATLSDGDALSAVLQEGGAEPLTVRRALRRGGPHTTPVKVLALLEQANRLFSPARASKALAWGQAYAREIAETIGDGVLLHPPFASLAPLHGRTYGRLYVLHPMAVFNLAGVPVTQVPLGLGSRELPLGVQVAAAPGRDHVSIAVAMELERVFGGWVPPSA